MPNRLRSARSAGRLDLTQGLCLAGRTGDRVICGRIANAGLRKIPYVSALLTLVARQAAELKPKGPTDRQPETAVEVCKPDATEQPDDQPIPTPTPDLSNHPRAYWAPGATPKRAPRDPGLPRPPQPLDSAGLGPGRVPPGGFEVG